MALDKDTAARIAAQVADWRPLDAAERDLLRRGLAPRRAARLPAPRTTAAPTAGAA